MDNGIFKLHTCQLYRVNLHSADSLGSHSNDYVLYTCTKLYPFIRSIYKQINEYITIEGPANLQLSFDLNRYTQFDTRMETETQKAALPEAVKGLVHLKEAREYTKQTQLFKL